MLGIITFLIWGVEVRSSPRWVLSPVRLVAGARSLLLLLAVAMIGCWRDEPLIAREVFMEAEGEMVRRCTMLGVAGRIEEVPPDITPLRAVVWPPDTPVSLLLLERMEPIKGVLRPVLGVAMELLPRRPVAKGAESPVPLLLLDREEPPPAAEKRGRLDKASPEPARPVLDCRLVAEPGREEERGST